MDLLCLKALLFAFCALFNALLWRRSSPFIFTLPQKSLVHAPFWLDSGNHLLFPLKTPEGYSLLLWDIWLDHARGRTPYSPYFQGFCHTDSPKIRGEEQIYFLQQTEKESLLCVAFLKKLEEVQTLYSFPGTICATWSAPPFLHLLLKKDSFTFSLSTWNYSEKKLAFPPVIATLLPSSPNESSPSFFSSLFPFGKENTLCSAWPCSDGYWSLSEWDYVQQRHTLFPSSLCLGVRGKKNQYFKYQQDSSSLQLSLIRWKETETQQISEESIFETSFPNRDLEPSRTSLPYSASSFSRTYFQELKIFSTPLALRDSSTYGF
jgi:hypothetical protein